MSPRPQSNASSPAVLSAAAGPTTVRRTRPWQRPRASQPRLTRQAPLLYSPAHGANQVVLTLARKSYRLVHPVVALLTVTGRPSYRLVHGRRPQAPPPCPPRRAPRSSGGLVHGSGHEPRSLIRRGKPHYCPASPTAMGRPPSPLPCPRGKTYGPAVSFKPRHLVRRDGPRNLAATSLAASPAAAGPAAFREPGPQRRAPRPALGLLRSEGPTVPRCRPRSMATGHGPRSLVHNGDPRDHLAT